jgi:exonuclease V
MAPPVAQLATTTPEYGSDIDVRSIATLSDYGSDIGLDDLDEDTILGDALDAIRGRVPTTKSAILPSIEFEEGELEDEEEHVDGFVHIHRPTQLRVSKATTSRGDHVEVKTGGRSSPVRARDALEVEYDERSRRAWSGTL